MKESILKYKKIGLIAVLVIVILSSILIYNTSGFKQLNKNDNESIFVDDENNTSDEGLQNNNYKDDSSYLNSAAENKLQNKTIIVEIKGQVKNPDVYTLDENSIINDLITLAGGVTENADLSSINRAKKLQNHEMIYIADKNEASIAQNSMADPSEHSVMSESLVDINTAEAEQLKTLNGIGDSKAKSIIEYREQNGGFKSIEEIKNVTGIGEKMFEKIKDNITV
ncbi:helix-hairpin-helix domain-containing protein [uncultured Clostridium sp.]|uniref:helix-hairpin-helix domain-containing protein n=1 Tax=uncultured Clostridium sp. TaxID=59620 RepID=UPI0025F10344|nr:helix-hairpin-helix domain-containing protein [uncultured Clostridium sp.]